MGQKIHPLGFRLGVSQEHRCYWIGPAKYYANWLLEDHYLRLYLKKRFPKTWFARITVMKKGIMVYPFPYPTDPINPVWNCLFISVNELPDELEGINLEVRRPEEHMEVRRDRNRQFCEEVTEHMLALKEISRDTTIQVRKVISHQIQYPHLNPVLINHQVIAKLEKRDPYRRTVKQALWDAYDFLARPHPYGMKIQISGRLDGAEMARTEWFSRGFLPLQTLRARIDYSSNTAHTLYGSVGLKTWIWHPINQAYWDKCGFIHRMYGFPRNKDWRRRTRQALKKRGRLMARVYAINKVLMQRRQDKQEARAQRRQRTGRYRCA